MGDSAATPEAASDCAAGRWDAQQQGDFCCEADMPREPSRDHLRAAFRLARAAIPIHNTDLRK